MTGWRTFRRSRAFVPAAVLVPIVALSSGVGAYAAWDSTRLDVPDVVGQSLVDGLALLERLDFRVGDVELPDPAMGMGCYIIAAQSLPAGSRVILDETELRLEIEPARRAVPDVTGLTLAEASQTLQASCLRARQSRLWCVPDGFSGGTEALRAPSLEPETGFTFDPFFSRLRHDSLSPADSWIVCDQLTAPSQYEDASSDVGLILTAPLTIVPEPPAPTLAAALDSLESTADECALTPQIVTTFPDNPGALRGTPAPSTEHMADWAVASLAPVPGRAVLCGERVRVTLIWPKTTMPQLVGLFHSPETPQTATATMSALQFAGLTTTCSGRGTVTSQSPAAGSPVPIGTAITCLAELVMPNIVGMDPGSAQATLVAAGLTGISTGSGIVVRQSPAAGTRVTGSQGVTFYAEVPQPQSFVGGGGSAYYKNCDAARAAGAAPIYRGEPGYRPALDRDDDGIACE